jgi:hypothetical protein
VNPGSRLVPGGEPAHKDFRLSWSARCETAARHPLPMQVRYFPDRGPAACCRWAARSIARFPVPGLMEVLGVPASSTLVTPNERGLAGSRAGRSMMLPSSSAIPCAAFSGSMPDTAPDTYAAGSGTGRATVGSPRSTVLPRSKAVTLL